MHPNSLRFDYMGMNTLTYWTYFFHCFWITILNSKYRAPEETPNGPYYPIWEGLGNSDVALKMSLLITFMPPFKTALLFPTFHLDDINCKIMFLLLISPLFHYSANGGKGNKNKSCFSWVRYEEEWKQRFHSISKRQNIRVPICIVSW